MVSEGSTVHVGDSLGRGWGRVGTCMEHLVRGR